MPDNISRAELSIVNMFQNFIDNNDFDDTQKYFVDEILFNLKRITFNDKKIRELNDQLLLKIEDDCFGHLDMIEIAKKIMKQENPNLPDDFVPVLRSKSVASGTTTTEMTEDEIVLWEMVVSNYNYMYRIFVICINDLKLLQFECKKANDTRNNLIVHSKVVRDTFSYTSNGPVIKGGRRNDKTELFKTAGNYYDDYNEFVKNFLDVVVSNNHPIGIG